MENTKLNLTQEGYRGYLLWLALPLIIGIIFASLIPQPVVGLITLGTSIDSYSAKTLIDQIDYARNRPDVRAVVLILDSPGGTVTDTEAVYFELLKLRKDKPVVVSINSMAASGAYYLTAGADYAYAKPTSQVGNVGVIGYLPPAPTIFEGIISTGPYKLWGNPRDTYVRQIEVVKREFFDVVKAGRGAKLEAEPEVILSGQIWPGSEAVKLGLIDELGAQSDAVEKAANLAQISNYKTEDLADLLPPQPTALPVGSFATTSAGASIPYPKEPGVYMLYIPPMLTEQK